MQPHNHTLVKAAEPAPTAAEIEAEAEARQLQQRLQVYMAACQLALRKTPDRARFRTGVSHTTIRMVPREMGLLVKGGDTPSQFKAWDKPRYAAVPHITYPYTFDGDITCVKVQDLVDGSTVTVPVTRGDIGVFMEAFDKAPPVLIVAPDPVSAAIIYGNCTAESALKPPVVAVAGFPLPRTFAGTGVIRIVSTPQTPLTLRQALGALASPQPIIGAKTPPVLQVWWNACAPSAMTAELVRRGLSKDCENVTALDLWTAKEIAHMADTGNVEDVYREISRAGLDDSVRARLVELAQGISAKAVDALTASAAAKMRCLVLGNGRQFWRRERGIIASAHDGKEEVIANVGIEVCHKLKAYDGSETLRCMVTPEDPAVPAVGVVIPNKRRKTAEELQALIVSAFSAAGHAPYVAVYDRNGYSWRDVLAKLAEGCDVRHEVKAMGADANHDIHFPAAVVRVDSAAVEPQSQIYTLPRHTLQMYAGITPADDDDGLDAYKALFRSCNNLYVAAFTHGLMHVVHQATYGLRQHGHGKIWTPRHLLFVETESGIWEPVFAQLASLFSNSDHIPTLGFTDALASACSYRELGTLPMIAHVPRLRGHQFPRFIMESPVSLIGLVDSATAALTGGDLRTTFLTPACDKPAQVCTIDAAAIASLRNGFPRFLLRYVENVEWESYRGKSSASQAAYEAACKILGVDVEPLVGAIAKKYFPSAGLTGVDTFFDQLHRQLNNHRHRRNLACIVHGDPPADASFTGRGQHIFVMPDRVVISHAVVATMNRDDLSSARFDRTLLTQEFEERGLLASVPERLNVDTNRCWVLDRRTWDALVVRPPLLLPGFVKPGSVIQLQSITARTA